MTTTTTTTTTTVEEFRRYAQGRRGERRRGAPRYPDAMVAFAVQHARAARAVGRSVHAAAAELGVSSMTLSTWLSRSSGPQRSRLREIVVRADELRAQGSDRSIEVKTASGHIVRGLSVSDAAALLRALS